MNAVTKLSDELGPVKPWLVGILNITPDSFSDGGVFFQPETAITRALELKSHGAHIIDIGGESTAPGSKPISAGEELRRIQEAVSVLARQVFLSIDTFRAATARAGLELGARMINDVSALRFDPGMPEVIKEHGAWVVLMHSKEDGSHPHVSNSKHDYDDVIEEIIAFLSRRIEYALKCGIKESKIILDPGMGRFLSDDPKYSWQVLEHWERLASHFSQFPLMVGTSRKGFLGGELTERDPASQLTALLAWIKGASLIRTHNVKMAAEFLKIWQSTNPGCKYH